MTAHRSSNSSHSALSSLTTPAIRSHASTGSIAIDRPSWRSRNGYFSPASTWSWRPQWWAWALSAQTHSLLSRKTFRHCQPELMREMMEQLALHLMHINHHGALRSRARRLSSHHPMPSVYLYLHMWIISLILNVTIRTIPVHHTSKQQRCWVCDQHTLWPWLECSKCAFVLL